MSGSLSGWRANLRPASWRGVAFQVLGSEALFGRRVHVHEYPFRDQPWAEDLGRRSRAMLVKGFLIGDDVAAQLEELQAAAEAKGPGTLVHPLRGEFTVTLLNLAAADAWDEGRIVRLSMEFIETGARRFPGSVTNGAAEVDGVCEALDKVVGEGGAKALTATVSEGYAGAQSVVQTARSYVATARGLVSSATGALRSVSAVAGMLGLGDVGRFLNATSRTINTGFGRVTSLTSGVNGALSRFSTARSQVTRLGDTVVNLAGRL
ncbi:DNA circularization N-terminal domain-containing protein [Muricoccus nepalensis]|uniref:DNA circularization N-terminal domain-containing protein n=1 Tax=Muricoccus nepalensis TaxID=1854500 RepID=UPI001386B8D9|nr:DNA circularization N-terminal domain-containing protein [Roseomonas nepalensis]